MGAIMVYWWGYIRRTEKKIATIIMDYIRFWGYTGNPTSPVIKKQGGDVVTMGDGGSILLVIREGIVKS